MKSNSIETVFSDWERVNYIEDEVENDWKAQNNIYAFNILKKLNLGNKSIYT